MASLPDKECPGLKPPETDLCVEKPSCSGTASSQVLADSVSCDDADGDDGGGDAGGAGDAGSFVLQLPIFYLVGFWWDDHSRL